MLFSIGALSVLLSALLLALYAGQLIIRRTIAWFRNKPGPRQKRLALPIAIAASGFLIGSIIQPVWDNSATCRDVGKHVALCLLHAI